MFEKDPFKKNSAIFFTGRRLDKKKIFFHFQKFFRQKIGGEKLMNRWIFSSIILIFLEKIEKLKISRGPWKNYFWPPYFSWFYLKFHWNTKIKKEQKCSILKILDWLKFQVKMKNLCRKVEIFLKKWKNFVKIDIFCKFIVNPPVSELKSHDSGVGVKIHIN